MKEKVVNNTLEIIIIHTYTHTDDLLSCLRTDIVHCLLIDATFFLIVFKHHHNKT